MSKSLREQRIEASRDLNLKREELKLLTLENKMACRNETIDVFNAVRKALQSVAPTLKMKADGSLNKKSKEIVDKIAEEYQKDRIVIAAFLKSSKLHVRITNHYNMHRLTVREQEEEIVTQTIRETDYVYNLDTNEKSTLIEYTKYTAQDVIEAEKRQAKVEEEVQMLQNEIARCKLITGC